MAVSLVNNLGSSNSQTRLNASGAKLNQTIQRLSSGLRINNSGDDAAGLAIANKYRSDINVLNQGVRNANDGLSTLQIVDGGLNTISNLLDRASTLAAQSASNTFTGNRDTLQAEFTTVLSEITRQAENIGLVQNGVNNKKLTPIIGGGSDTFSAVNTNNGVQVDLSGATNRVDATSLSLNSLNIGTGTGSVTGAQAITTLTAAETLGFGTIGSSGELVFTSVSLSAGADGSTIIDTINSDATLKAAGVTASLDSNNKLVLSSANFFAVGSDTADGAGQTGIAGAGAAAFDSVITGAANTSSFAVTAAGAAGTQTLSFSGSEIGLEGTSYSVSFATDTTAGVGAANAAAAVNNDLTLRSKGIFAIVDHAAGDSIKFVSLKNFNLAVTDDTSAAAGANNNLTAQTPTAAVAGTVTGGATGALNALDAIGVAITSLGKVQGIVGAGQNRLQQAIDLATSQINNFQAAESRVRDADITAEASNLSRLSVLQQAGVAALAQANQSAQAVLSLLR